MKAKVLIVILIVGALAWLIIQSNRRITPASPQDQAGSSATDSENSPPAVPTKPGPPTTSTPPGENNTNAQENRPNEQLRPGANLQEQLQKLAERRGISMEVLTQQLAGELSNAFSQELNGRIDFYGKAINENGGPLTGATVTINCTIFPENQFTTNIVTDTNGLFTLQGVTGQSLTAFVKADGYTEIPGTNEHNFVYYGVVSVFQPDPYNPVIFRLRPIP